MVERKKFRLDLLHRLNTLHIHIPALRERPEDIKPLLNHFIDTYAVRFNKPDIHASKEVFDSLYRYDFPGNVRELRNMTERAIILCKGNTLGINDFPVRSYKPDSTVQKEDIADLKNNEIKIIRRALQKSKFNQKVAADILGITRDTLIRKMKKYNITVTRSEED